MMWIELSLEINGTPYSVREEAQEGLLSLQSLQLAARLRQIVRVREDLEPDHPPTGG